DVGRCRPRCRRCTCPGVCVQLPDLQESGWTMRRMRRKARMAIAGCCRSGWRTWLPLKNGYLITTQNEGVFMSAARLSTAGDKLACAYECAGLASYSYCEITVTEKRLKRNY